MTKTIKILDLFAGTQSVRKAIFEMYGVTAMGLNENNMWVGFGKNGIKIEYCGIDIYSPEKQNIHFDLSQKDIVNKLKKVLPLNWKPDFIWNSPICNKFSTACAYKGGNLFFEKVGADKIKIREEWNDRNNRAYTYEKCKIKKQTYQNEAKLALDLHNNGKKIIDYFKSPFIIENPRRAMSKYLYKEYVNNFTSYCMYGFKYEKPTTIYSNVKLELLTCDHKPKRDYHTIMLSGSKKDYTNGRKNMSSYSQRSSVPPKLIQSILSQVLD